MSYSPPFRLTHQMMTLVSEISEMIGRWTAVNHRGLVPELRRENRIRTIQASLAVEQNTLSCNRPICHRTISRIIYHTIR